MKLMNELRRLEPGTMVHLGAQSSYLDIFPVEEALDGQLLDDLSRKCLEKKVALLSELDTHSQRYKQAKEYVDSFVPLSEREVISSYPLIKQGCMAVIVTGTEAGRYWYLEEKYHSQEKSIDMPYVTNIINPIIEQAAEDYFNIIAGFGISPPYNDEYTNREDLERFFHSRWYNSLTNLNPDYLIRKLKEGATKMILEYTVSKEYGNSMYYVHRVGDTERLSKLYPTKKDALHRAAEMQGLDYKLYMKIRRRDGADMDKHENVYSMDPDCKEGNCENYADY